MNRRGKIMGCVLSSVVLAIGARSSSGRRNGITRHDPADDAPYHEIVDRNVFGLKDPPPPVSHTETNAPPLDVELTGIMTILGKKQALFMVRKPSASGKPQSAPESYILAEGQRQGGLEVLNIDQKAANVKIRSDGIVSTITFEKSSQKGSAPPSRPAAYPPPNSFTAQRRPGFNPNFPLRPPPAPLQTGRHFPGPG